MATVRPSVTNTGASPKSLLGGLIDANAYATKKTIAQGMLDVALLTANASQLKYLLQVGTKHEFYHLMMTLICISIILQLAIGGVIILKSRFSINVASQEKTADILNNVVVWLVFGVTVTNVFVCAFGINVIPTRGEPIRANPQEKQALMAYNGTLQIAPYDHEYENT